MLDRSLLSEGSYLFQSPSGVTGEACSWNCVRVGMTRVLCQAASCNTTCRRRAKHRGTLLALRIIRRLSTALSVEEGSMQRSSFTSAVSQIGDSYD